MASRLVVEWTRTTVRVAFAEGRGANVRIKAIRSQAIGQSGEAHQALRALMEKLRPTDSSVVVVIPREQVITRIVKFPTTKPDELAQMVELYAKAQLPYPKDQTIFGFHIVSQREGFTTVGVVACQREVVDRQIALLRRVGLEPGLVTVSSWGVLGWYQRRARMKEPCLVVNIDDARTDLVLIAGGRILSSRSVGQGAQDWQALGGEVPELLAREVDRSRASIHKELPGTEVVSLVLTGCGALSQWSDPVSQRLSLSVLTVEGARSLPGGSAPAIPEISPVVIAGLAGADARGLLDLSPPETRVHIRHHRQVRELSTVGLLLAGVFGLGAGLLALQIGRQQQRASQLDRALSEVEPIAKRIQEQAHSAQLVGVLLDDRRQLAAILSGVFQLTPGNVNLEVVSFERARQELTVRGNANSTQDALAYITQLQQLDGVRDVTLKYSTRRATASGERTDFELLLSVRNRERGAPS